MPGYTREELGRIANAVRNVWASCYNGGFIQGMTKSINSTGAEAFLGLQGDVIEIIGSDSIFSGIPLTAIIAMGPEGVEEALRIQNGYGPFDMKPGFLKRPKAKTNKEGKKYIAIPFRHMTPGATGPGKKMSPSVHKAAMKKVDQGVKFSDQLGTKEDPSDFGMVNSRGYEWQNGPYAGMVNIRDEKGKHSQYRTFRMISENSAPNAWWHPGVQSNDVVGAVVDYVQPYVKEGLKMAAKAEVVDKIYEIFKQT
ncbi:hypothetical protein KAR91_65210 [Candidatus Pacearchaeota archaeon]|nr:hypothetical protein [Candidatus Pacearchaeota archaeon]